MSVDVVTFNEVLAQSRLLNQKIEMLLKSADPRLNSYATNQALIDTKNQLDATIKSNAPARSYTNERGVKLDKLDNINVALSSRASQSTVDNINAEVNKSITSMKTVTVNNYRAPAGKVLLTVAGNGHIDLMINTTKSATVNFIRINLVIDDIDVLFTNEDVPPFKNIRFRRNFKIINKIDNSINNSSYDSRIYYSLY